MNIKTIAPQQLYQHLIAACLIITINLSMTAIPNAQEQENAYPLENTPLPLYAVEIQEDQIVQGQKLEFCISKDACVDDGAKIFIDVKAGSLNKPVIAKLTLDKTDMGTVEVDLSETWGGGEITFYQLELDETNDHQEILIASYSGGAHCCGIFKVLAVYDDKLSFTHFITANGGPEVRIHSDGSLPFTDDRFLYAFGAYAESFSLIRYFKFQHGKRVDLSKQPQFKTSYLKEMETLKSSCSKVDHLPACAAYAAAAARTGKFYEAWNFINTHYIQDPNREEQYPYFCTKQNRNDEPCPENEEVKFNSFPEALLFALKEWDYVEK